MQQVTQAYIDRHFEMPGQFLADLDADAAAELITAAADVVLILDEAGVIRDLAFGSEDLAAQGCNEWLGKTWSQTVTVESQPKVEAMLKQAVSGDGVRWRHVNHPVLGGGADLPLSYSVVPVRRKGQPAATASTHTLAFGRDLRAQVALQQRLVTAQLSLERDYWRLRQVETRYRLLFQMAAEPVLILNGSIAKVEEANPAAHELFGEKAKRAGWTLTDSLDAESAEALRALLERLRATGKAEPLSLRLEGHAQPLVLTASQFRQDNNLHFLLRFALSGAQPSAGRSDSGQQQLLQVMESAPDAFVVTDLDGRVLSVNRAFLDLGQLASQDQAQGQLLDKWLGRTGVDFRVLLSNLRQHGAVKLFATQMRGDLGASAEVEISAVAVATGEQRCLGFVIRDMGRRLTADGRGVKELPRSASQMTELVGRLPLKDIVRETTDLIEQLCIEAALQLTGDNRASAAEMLGLSRQSLYIKLRRFGIGDATQDVEH
jgi:transcriptional regulator PpsR